MPQVRRREERSLHDPVWALGVQRRPCSPRVPACGGQDAQTGMTGSHGSGVGDMERRVLWV